jgi:hypothetical protein
MAALRSFSISMRLSLMTAFVLFAGCTERLLPEYLFHPEHLTRAAVTWDGAGAPLGRFLLVRKDKAVCALRFTKARRGHDIKPTTVFHSGEENFFAEYDWYFQGDGSGNFARRGVLSGHRRLHRKPLIGIGRLAFQTGQVHVNCGTFRDLLWLYPTRVSFYGGSRRGDDGIEMAPTKWADIKEVDVHDPRLKWYRYEENRQSIYIPLEDLN